MKKLELASDDKVGLLDVIVLPFLIAVTPQTLLKSVSCYQGACFHVLHLPINLDFATFLDFVFQKL
jgi:hypothetical protein